MRNVILIAAAFAALASTAASAQGWRGDDDAWRGRGMHRGWDRGDDWRRRHWSRGECRTVVIRSEDDYGNVRVKRVRRCD
jgi:Ni/Co efflux regulator RcnB